MKKIIAFLILLLCVKQSYAQYPLKQYLGSDSTLVTVRGGMNARVVLWSFTDTTQANTQRISQYAGALIYTTGTDKVWYRNSTATGWIEFTSSGGSTVNIYNSDGDLTGERQLGGNGYNLRFNDIREFGIGADSLSVVLNYPKYKITGLSQTTDTTTYKPLAIDADGYFTIMDRWPGGGSKFGLEDILATSARRFSGGGNTFTLDSLGATTIRTYTTSAIKMVATNGTDSAWIEVQRGVPASGKKVIAWAKHSTTALNYMQLTGGGFTTSITNPTSGDGSSITTTTQSHALTSSNASDFSTININKDTIALLSTSATSGLKISGILKRNSSPDLKLVKIDTTNGQISYYDDGTVAGTYVPDTRILTINGVAYDLSADRSWTVIPDSTFYTANGTITYARRINANGYPITFDSIGLFRIRDTSVSSTGALYGHIYDFNDGVDFLDYDSLLTVGYTQNSLTGIHLYVKDKNNLDTSIYVKLNPDNILLQGITKTNSRLEKAQGADVASAAGAITLGSDGNSFEITGTSSITAISNINWQNGSEIILLFTSTATLVDGTANSGTDIGFELAGNANFTASAGAIWKGILSEIGGTQRWREVSRTVN